LSAPGAGLYDAGRYRRVRNRVRPEMIRDTPVAEELLAELERLLDENLVSAAARRELDAMRYGIAMARRY
jgi:hypothetical protein